MTEAERRLRDSWQANAGVWTRAVRGGQIQSRRAGTDAAIVSLCRRVIAEHGEAPAARARVLDVGCGEGWLSRVLAGDGARVLGVDASAALVAAASEAGGGADYAVADYAQLVADDRVAPGPFDLVVCNFALLGDPLAPLLAALRSRLAPGGRLVVQTVHPWVAAGAGAYESGWREESFASFGEPFPAPMPWFFRTLASWLDEIGAAGLVVHSVEEPADPETRRPLSLLLLCGGR